MLDYETKRNRLEARMKPPNLDQTIALVIIGLITTWWALSIAVTRWLWIRA